MGPGDKSMVVGSDRIAFEHADHTGSGISNIFDWFQLGNCRPQKWWTLIEFRIPTWLVRPQDNAGSSQYLGEFPQKIIVESSQQGDRPKNKVEFLPATSHIYPHLHIPYITHLWIVDFMENPNLIAGWFVWGYPHDYCLTPMKPSWDDDDLENPDSKRVMKIAIGWLFFSTCPS